MSPGMGVYGISKAGVIMLTQVLAMELGHANIQVNGIAPGVIKTRFSQVLWQTPHRAEYIEYRIRHRRVLSGPEYPIDETLAREHAGRRFDRSPTHPAGFARQLAAILASGSRKEALKSVTAPTLVIHGNADPLVPVECGIDTANAIPGAELLIIEGMGHDWRPPALWPQVMEAIVRHAV
jgi:NAD(P)-dependent dehydrogenase (short-subunit alcohol dehydrogenase family)